MKDVEQSYMRQADSERGMELPSRYSHPDSIDNWRHTRMLSLTRTLWLQCPGSDWLTVGDGRYGSDAAYLHANGVSVTATSLTDDRLRHACDLGYIPAYRAENAEKLSLPEDAVDFVLCKEAYHHFPRPPIALYEMLRVARKGVVLIEPLDNPRLFDGAKRLLKRFLRGDREHEFEPSGNFLYRLNLRELGKLMAATGGDTIAFKGINDFYHRGLGRYPARAHWAFSITRLGIHVQNLLSSMGLLGFGLGCVVVFKGKPGDGMSDALRRDGYTIIKLPINPYVGRD